jgi:acetylornithine deacetylase/succinyl-diaminopimelate desuccinylase-like protein
MTMIRGILLALTCALGASAQHPAEFAATRTLDHAAYRLAAQHLDRNYDRFVAELVALVEVEAPPFKEEARAQTFMRLAGASGLTTERDAEGNVLALRRGGAGPLLVVAAHLDTVFPEGTAVTVRRNGTRLSAPGIGDNAQGVAALLALARALDAAEARTSGDILFLANVGEEGSGGLRGVRHVFAEGRYKDRIGAFISIDGTGSGEFITTGGVGSRRYRVTFNGPGGHSYGAFGLVNPATAMAGAMQALSSIPVPAAPKTTFNVGMVGGGTSVNTIPAAVWMDVDLRSESPSELLKLDEAFKAGVLGAVADENRARSTSQGPITVDLALIGERPSGQTAATTAIVQASAAAVRASGLQPTFGWSSTDANLPMSLGIPAITIDSGVRGDRAHAPDEWIDIDRRTVVRGLQRSLLIVLSVAGLEP